MRSWIRPAATLIVVMHVFPRYCPFSHLCLPTLFLGRYGPESLPPPSPGPRSYHSPTPEPVCDMRWAVEGSPISLHAASCVLASCHLLAQEAGAEAAKKLRLAGAAAKGGLASWEDQVTRGVGSGGAEERGGGRSK